LEIGVQTAAADFSFVLSAASEAQGQEIAIKIDLAPGELQIRLKAGDGSGAFDIVVHRIFDKGDEVFAHKGIVVDSADTLYLKFGNWAGNGQNIALEVDKSSDGTRDDKLDLSDDD
jgi:hypothetical protein